jgi:hypothetical protein
MDQMLEPVTDTSFGDVPPGMGAMAIMGREGDTKYIWDKTKPAEVDVARQTFNTFIKEKKYTAFTVVGDGTKGEQVKEFDPNEQRYIFVPAMQGG